MSDDATAIAREGHSRFCLGTRQRQLVSPETGPAQNETFSVAVGDAGGRNLSCCSAAPRTTCKLADEEFVPMNVKSLLVRPWLTVLLVALILITRTNSSTATIYTPDVTLAAFFVAGLWAPSAFVFAVLFAAAALADQVSFMLGVSAWCFTAAYVFLVPTYACLMYAGYVCRNADFFKLAGAAKLTVYFVVAVIAAYLISSYSFYFLSGRLTSATSVIEYQNGLTQHFPNYIGWASMYTVLALAVASAVRLTSRTRASASR
jgi:hypothetical protein